MDMDSASSPQELQKWLSKFISDAQSAYEPGIARGGNAQEWQKWLNETLHAGQMAFQTDLTPLGSTLDDVNKTFTSSLGPALQKFTQGLSNTTTAIGGFKNHLGDATGELVKFVAVVKSASDAIATSGFVGRAAVKPMIDTSAIVASVETPRGHSSDRGVKTNCPSPSSRTSSAKRTRLRRARSTCRIEPRRTSVALSAAMLRESTMSRIADAMDASRPGRSSMTLRRFSTMPTIASICSVTAEVSESRQLRAAARSSNAATNSDSSNSSLRSSMRGQQPSPSDGEPTMNGPRHHRIEEKKRAPWGQFAALSDTPRTHRG
jgi:hypothetical protein